MGGSVPRGTMSKYVTLRCDSCEPLAINGVACHETGCPESWKSPVTGEPYLVKCRWCDATFKPEDKGDRYCDASCYAAYNGLPDPSDSYNDEGLGASEAGGEIL